jgi:hypothetical protein
MPNGVSVAGSVCAGEGLLSSVRVFCVAADVAPGFVVRFICVEVLPSARRHGVEDADIDHALRHATVIDEVDEDPVRYLLIGPDRSGNLLEMIVLDRPQGPAVIHAMSLRAKYCRLLPPGERP